jgi:acetyl-CoA carboxylase biotin carboxyl carrier protein
MTESIQNARALLRLFEATGNSDMHVRVGVFEIYVARSHGGLNPMLARSGNPGAPETRQANEALASIIVTAPHICTIVSVLPVGSAVDCGGTIARLAVLDETIDLAADQVGIIAEVFVEAGQLAEYGAPIARVTPLPSPA